MNAPSYFAAIHRLLTELESGQSTQILAAARMLSDCIGAGGVVHVFGSGHSHIIAEEAFHRAGGLAAINPILDPNLTSFGLLRASDLERWEGYAQILVSSYDVRADEVVVVASNSGINAVPIEVAIESQRAGAKVVAITSVRSHAEISSRHSGNKKLADIADVVIDSGVPMGDAAIEIAPGIRAGPTSTVICAAILNALVVETARILSARGTPPPVLTSINTPDGGAINQTLLSQFRGRIRVMRDR